jgi:hypothetical protein
MPVLPPAALSASTSHLMVKTLVTSSKPNYPPTLAKVIGGLDILVVVRGKVVIVSPAAMRVVVSVMVQVTVLKPQPTSA